MDKKEIIGIVIKVAIYALTLIGAALGVYAMSSCTTQARVESVGRTYIYTHDTTIVNHDAFIKTKNYNPLNVTK